eukprot:CAMPEP_0117001366 /NCGR_PEP_ID=MMETSP0472-20121206/3392_1 /TAXON_ID=693140 ORGANISM="Tiarina fusus, Strain LIS" /NCGR_SAMPLE_ID=MMETSP0472 /ASSEMBLY_ACC=CAM_ASM_000603 /LENGTH=519 /DNA_ID=CAMNT_0004701355 /DNA_START=107 /DNA_END=1666 /DNA_ORIENTATION=+
MKMFSSKKTTASVKNSKTADSEKGGPPAPAPVTAPTVEVTDKSKTEPLLSKDEKEASAPVAVPNPPSGDAEAALKPKYEEPSKLDMAMLRAKVAIFTCCGIPPIVKYFVVGAVVSGAIIFGLMRAVAAASPQRNVAIIGNSYFFVNDLPRLMESISDGHIYQDSCLHGSGSLLNLLKTGNGMYYRWNTDNALLEDVEYVNDEGQNVQIYDYGACSVPQLLLGQDAMLSYQNEDGKFLNDGNNPCIEDQNYLAYQTSFNYSDPWDFVVLADQSKRMAFEETRGDALLSLNYTYGPILGIIKATPIIVQSHAFWSQNANMTGLTDVPTFTSLVMEGANVYKTFLKKKSANGRIAPVGDAFLTVWEEDYDLWLTLFLGDMIHPSPKGTYLYALVLYATIYKALPDVDIAVTDDIVSLFDDARKIHSNNETHFPTEDEAAYLNNVAKRVVLRSFTPRSYKSIGKEGDDTYVAAEEEYDGEADGEEYEYGDDAAEVDGYNDDAAQYQWNQGDDAAAAEGDDANQ